MTWLIFKQFLKFKKNQQKMYVFLMLNDWSQLLTSMAKPFSVWLKQSEGNFVVISLYQGRISLKSCNKIVVKINRYKKQCKITEFFYIAKGVLISCDIDVNDSSNFACAAV